jgi:import inner membrane translocase subunit TIM23
MSSSPPDDNNKAAVGDLPPLPSLNNINPAMFAPMYGQKPLLREPEYLDYNVQGRPWLERMFYNVGTSYLAGNILGGSFGFVEGFRTSPSPKFNIRLNSVLNKTSRRGSRLGNALGSLAALYSFCELGLSYTNIDNYSPWRAEWVQPLVCATATGLLYKSSAGPRTMVLAGGIGASMVLAAHTAKPFLPFHTKKTLLFF